ncbi:MAG: PP2C family protein-serine/threonine phosphatase [Treponema sp.]
MVYVLTNFVFCGVLIWASFAFDTRNRLKTDNTLINAILFLAMLFGINGLNLLLSIVIPLQLVNLIGKVLFFLAGCYAVYTCVYMLINPNYKKSKPIIVFQWILYAFAFVILFLIPGAVSSINVSLSYGYRITSAEFFTGRLANIIPLTWFQFYIAFFFVILPLFCMIMVLVRAENLNSKLDRERMRIICFGILISWFIFALLLLANKHQCLISTIMLLPLIGEIILFMQSASIDSVYDQKTILKVVLRFFLRYIVPSAIVGFVFTLIWRNLSDNKQLGIFLYILTIVAVITIWYQFKKLFAKKNLLADNNYAKRFEDDIASIDYSGDTNEITAKVYDIFKTNLSTSNLQILIDNGVGNLETIYTTNESKITVPLSNPCFDVLLNINHQIIFRDYAEHNYIVSNIRQDLIELLDNTNSDAFILLNEGRHIIGAIVLGKKANGNVYNDYDYNVFTKLYSYFFVMGYYMKNIVNESVVGTVNREIRMSGQIITSIQENMDQIKNPKIDSGYLMVPAHNIGGEFIDLIRLTETRHIFVIGAMSGKGIAASMSMVILKSVIRTFLAETKDFKLLVEKVNTFIRTSLPKGSYFAGMFGLIDFATDTMYYINCGSPALFLYTRAYNNVIEVQGEGRILGFAKDISRLVKVKKVKLAEGDIVLSCTAGLIETHSLRGEIFGKDRAQKALMDNATYPSTKMAQFTYDSLVQFTSKEIEDDVTILVLKYLGGK